MVPFICKDVQKLDRSLVELVVKPGILTKNNTALKLISLDLDEEDYLLELNLVHFYFIKNC